MISSSYRPREGKDLASETLLFVVNDPAFFLSHRLPLGRAARDSGYEVIVATGPGDGVYTIQQEGMTHYPLPLTRSGTNPVGELRLLLAIGQLYRRIQPDIVHLVTIKPVLYGGIMARLSRVPGVVSAISGMGYLFTGDRSGPARRAAEMLYRLALGHSNSRVIVQNTTDRDALHDMGALKRDQDVLIPGSGVDLAVFRPVPLPEGEPLVVLPARMLWDKGVGEFVEAASLLRERGVNSRFALVGGHDESNPGAVPESTLKAWQQSGPVEWWGKQADMPGVLASASLVILPSYYREGVPKALLEALAAGRAVVTTDAPGCRDVIEEGRNGFLVPVRDAQALADVMEKILADPQRLQTMGEYGRAKAEREFGVDSVVEAHLQVYRALAEAESG